MRTRSSASTCVVAVVLGVCLLASGCGNLGPTARSSESRASGPGEARRAPLAATKVAPPFRDPLPGMPPVLRNDVYAATRAGMLSPEARRAKPLIYVPDSYGERVTVIDPRTHKVVRVLPAGFLSQHVVPSYDLKRLIVNSSAANELEVIDPRTGRETRSIPVPRPYNLYFTPDGKQAVVMVEEYNAIRFADPHTFTKRQEILPKGCKGPNHADFSGNGRYFVVSCEFSGALLKVSTLRHRVVDTLHLAPRPRSRQASPNQLMGMSMPQDVRLSPDGRTFYVADMGTNELRLIDARTFRQRKVIGLPAHPHGIYPSRDGRYLYVSDRGAGKVSVVDVRTEKVVDTWVIPGGGSPDMGGVSVDGRWLWLSGRYDGVVYCFDTRTGKLVAKIPVGGSPHGLAVWPQPGRYSLGHTGNMR